MILTGDRSEGHRPIPTAAVHPGVGGSRSGVATEQCHLGMPLEHSACVRCDHEGGMLIVKRFRFCSACLSGFPSSISKTTVFFGLAGEASRQLKRAFSPVLRPFSAFSQCCAHWRIVAIRGFSQWRACPPGIVSHLTGDVADFCSVHFCSVRCTAVF